ncbi:MAG: M20 family metallopeptidase [Pelagimonas sp.]|jgi:hippurate hydrolase|nr:M20 family metallopeptidase [Pelagimonas sp.]
MPVINSIAALSEDMKTWRRHLHQNPEIGLECHATADFVIEKLKSFGISDMSTGWAKSGVIAIIEGRAPGRTIGLRADMDALPMQDLSGADHASQVADRSHACGHDGHTTMLLGAAKYLAETRNFAGRVALIFQPGEEGHDGGKIMVEEGMMERYAIEEVYGIHNMPGLTAGHIHTRPGALLAGAAEFTIDIQGRGGHGAMPSKALDPIVAAASIVQALQSIVSRNVDASDQVVLSVATIHAGTAMNIIPDSAQMTGTVRFYDDALARTVQTRMEEVVAFQAKSFGMEGKLTYRVVCPPTVNDPDKAAFAAGIAREVVGEEQSNGDTDPIMPTEDFSYMLEARPGAYMFLGQGDTPMCHHPAYDFNDDISPVGASFFATLVERALPLKGG